jgi:hypothetical protein
MSKPCCWIRRRGGWIDARSGDLIPHWMALAPTVRKFSHGLSPASPPSPGRLTGRSRSVRPSYSMHRVVGHELASE